MSRVLRPLHRFHLNAKEQEEYDLDVLIRFVQLFPTAPLAKLLRAYFAYAQIPSNIAEEQVSGNEDKDDDYAGLIMVGFYLFRNRGVI